MLPQLVEENVRVGGHRDAAELLITKVHYLFDRLQHPLPEWVYDVDTINYYLTNTSINDLLTFMSDDFGQGFIIGRTLSIAEQDVEAANADSEA